MAKKKKAKWKDDIKFWLVIIACVLAIAGACSFGIWFEIQSWHVYNYTHHTNIGYWTYQFFVAGRHS